MLPSATRCDATYFEPVGLRVMLFESARQLLDTKRPDTPSCIVPDVRLPEQSGPDFQRELNLRNIARLPETGHGDIPMSVHAMKAGAIEFLTKPFREHELWYAVQAALDEDRLQRAEQALLTELRRRSDALTPRERSVLAQQADRRRDRGQRGDRSNLMCKMQAASLADLMVMAARFRLSKGISKASKASKAL